MAKQTDMANPSGLGAVQIHELFDALRNKHKNASERTIPEVEVFRRALGTSWDPKVQIGRAAHRALAAFCRDVRTCPSEVIAYAQRLLNEPAPTHAPKQVRYIRKKKAAP